MNSWIETLFFFWSSESYIVFIQSHFILWHLDLVVTSFTFSPENWSICWVLHNKWPVKTMLISIQISNRYSIWISVWISIQIEMKFQSQYHCWFHWPISAALSQLLPHYKCNDSTFGCAYGRTKPALTLNVVNPINASIPTVSLFKIRSNVHQIRAGILTISQSHTIHYSCNDQQLVVRIIARHTSLIHN